MERHLPGRGVFDAFRNAVAVCIGIEDERGTGDLEASCDEVPERPGLMRADGRRADDGEAARAGEAF